MPVNNCVGQQEIPATVRQLQAPVHRGGTPREHRPPPLPGTGHIATHIRHPVRNHAADDEKRSRVGQPSTVRHAPAARVNLTVNLPRGCNRRHPSLNFPRCVPQPHSAFPPRWPARESESAAPNRCPRAPFRCEDKTHRWMRGAPLFPRAGRVPRVASTQVNWDDSQRDVIDAPPDARLLVSAGPGTGKTAVACARVARLIEDHGLDPGTVWLISFTRTAVREIRDRIADYLEAREDAYAVSLATLDSYAWSIHSGFEGSAALTTYEENIASVLELVRFDEAVGEYLRTVGHLVVDEAQDIVGVRSNLVVEMVRKLEPDSGITVFADDAQAIYGFAEEQQSVAGAPREPPLSGVIRNGGAGTFTEVELTTVHRTRSAALKTLFSGSRRRLLDRDVPPAERLDAIRNDVQAVSEGSPPRAGDGFPRNDDLLVLFRRRCEVLMASSFLAVAGIPHRLRMSGLPERLVPWIGAALSEVVSVRLGRAAFMDLWSERVHGTPLASCEASEAWEQLYRLAGMPGGVIDMKRLRQIFGRRRPSADVCLPDLGDHGPVIGTIHASKGRESERVHLMLPLPVHEERNADDEEARVVFVGATRGRSKLLVGQGYRQFPKHTDSGRVYQLHTAKGKPRAQVEVGREGDILAEGVAGRSFYADAAAVRHCQTALLEFSSGIHPLVASADRGKGFAYHLTAPGGVDRFAVLSNSVNTDLFSIAHDVQHATKSVPLRPPDKIAHLSVRGLRTIVLRADSQEADALHEPWRTTGMVLAPVIIGYTTMYFPTQRNRHA